jgi:hypothetical protein
VVEVIGKLVKGFADLVLAGAAFTIQSVQSKQAAQQMFRAMAGGKAAGDQLFGMMEDLATQLPQTKDELTAWSKEFTAMGILKQDALRTELRATASAAALMGDEGAEAFTLLTRKITESISTTGKLKLSEKQLASLAKTGANVDDVAKAMGVSTKTLAAHLKAGTVNATAFGDALNKALIEKGGSALDRMLGDVGVLRKKFDEMIGDMFEDVNIQPFIDSMKDLLSVFSQAQPSGQAMRAGIMGFFNSFFEWSAKAVLIAKHMFLDLEIFALRAYIAIKPYAGVLKDIAIGALVVAGVFAAVLVGAVLGVVGALAMLVAPSVAAVAAFVWLYDTIVNSWGQITGFVSGVVAGVLNTISGWLSSLYDLGAEISEWAIGAAAGLVEGLVNGIANGTGMIVDAVKGLAHSAIKSFKETLGIASPSKEFMKLGDFTARGFNMGISAQNDNAAAATAGLAQAATDGATRGASAAPAAGQAAAAGAPAKAGAGGVTIVVEAGAIVISGAAGDVNALTEHGVSLLFEKIALMQGVAA